MASPSSSSRGFSVAEILLSISLATIFFSAAAMIYQNVTNNVGALGTIENVTLGSDVLLNFYDLDQESITVFAAPNFGRAAFAAELVEVFRSDVAAASAVYCLGRTDLNIYRPETIPYPTGSAVLDSPERFRQHLVANASSAESAPFYAYESVSFVEDLSVFVIQPSDAIDELDVLSIYDIDIIALYGIGNYVSVRRYVDGTLSNYYDILYPEGTGTSFSPLAVHFYRKGLAGSLANPFDQRFAVAEEMPFYFLWWPDPAAHTLEAPVDPPIPAVPAGSPVLEYYQMGGRTRFMFTIPAFPSQQ